MSDQKARSYASFRLNLEQQQKRAKDLLKAAKADDAVALRRCKAPARATDCAEARARATLIARELRFATWAELKRHIGGRPLEVEETLGHAARTALRMGLSLPLLDAVYRIAAAIDRTSKGNAVRP